MFSRSIHNVANGKIFFFLMAEQNSNPSALLVGMQTGAATMENSMEITEKFENGSAF